MQVDILQKEKGEELVAQKEAEEQAQFVAIDAEKRAQEEEVLQEETETERSGIETNRACGELFIKIRILRYNNNIIWSKPFAR